MYDAWKSSRFFCVYLNKDIWIQSSPIHSINRILKKSSLFLNHFMLIKLEEEEKKIDVVKRNFFRSFVLRDFVFRKMELSAWDMKHVARFSNIYQTHRTCAVLSFIFYFVFNSIWLLNKFLTFIARAVFWSWCAIWCGNVNTVRRTTWW